MNVANRKVEIRRTKNRLVCRTLLIFPLLAGICFAQPQNSKSDIPPATDVIQFLSKTIYWYQQTQAEQQIVNDPTDLAFADSNQQMAEQIVRLAFDFARQSAELVEKESKSHQPQGGGDLSSYNGLAQAAASTDQQIQQTQAELQSLALQREGANGKKRPQIDSKIEEVKSELALLQARAAALRTMRSFVTGTGSDGLGATGLRGQIEELARSVPSILSETQDADKSNRPNANQSAASRAALTSKPYSGIWGLVSDLFHLSLKTRMLWHEVTAADTLLQAAKELRDPLMADIRQTIQTSSSVASQADSADAAGLADAKGQLDALTTQFKEVSSAAIPIDQQTILLDLYKRNLLNWRASIREQYIADLKNLIVRLGLLVVLAVAIFGFGELWRRTIFRYVQETRRRYQLLLVRRILVWSAIGLVLLFTFASQLSSVFTFAGLITAGVAVALQNVIISVVGYFFLIGKYGIKVGDRVQVAGVTGEVVEIGLVRFYLMELESGGGDSQPTGRVVAFANSIVFQPTAGLFKQIPGTSFIWHEIRLTFAPESDYQVVRERVNQAIESAFADYRESLERQQRQMELTLTSISTSQLKPKMRMHFAPSGLEVVVRYPVVFSKAQEIDDHLMTAFFAAVDREPKQKLIGSEVPTPKIAA